MHPTVTIGGPRGPVLIPGEPDEARRFAENCCRQLFAGEYDYAGDPCTFEVRGVERGGFEAGHDSLESFVEVGGNVGAFVIWACGWWPRLKRVVSYEPNLLLVPMYQRNVCELGIEATVVPVAVTTARNAFLQDSPNGDWAGNHTYGATSGVQVPCVHPDSLPPADGLKVDAEGVEVEVLEHYRYGTGLRVVIFEYHFPEHREVLERRCASWGLVRARHHGAHLHERRGMVPTHGIQVWIRP